MTERRETSLSVTQPLRLDVVASFLAFKANVSTSSQRTAKYIQLLLCGTNREIFKRTI